MKHCAALVVLLYLQLTCISANLVEFATDKSTIRVGGPKIQFLYRHGKGQDGKHQLKAEFSGKGADLSGPFKLCKAPEGGKCLQWDNGFKMKIHKSSPECNFVSLEGAHEDSPVEAYVFYRDAQWYGGPERYQQDWPIQKIIIDEPEPLVSLEKNSQAVLEAYWLSSDGVSIYVRPNISLFWWANKEGYEKTLGLVAANQSPYKPRGPPVLEFDMCFYENAVEAHYGAIANYLGKPKAHPGRGMMNYPTYSTWVREKRDINQEKVLNFTNSILDNGYPIGQIEIDDKWEPCYGDLTIDTNRFPNITQLTDYIHSKGGRVTAWVHPFINTDCPLYQQALSEGRLMLDSQGNAVSTWWNGKGGVVNFSNSTTRNWWVQRLQQLKKSSGLDGFKFDAGESSFYPQLPELTEGDPSMYPETLVRNYVEAALEFGEDIEVRVGHNTQDVPLFVRMLDRDSRWGLDNGLQSVLTTTLQMSLVGYPFVLPDMIGGNAYGVGPSSELFVRWLQLNTFLPALQFSIFPWDFNDEDTTIICKKYMDMRLSFNDYIQEAANDTLLDGKPLVRPVWWQYPDDDQTFPIWDQFIIGKELMVAPVTGLGERKRDVYIPTGTWITPRNETIIGPVWLRDYDAPLDYLPYFIRDHM